jgi:Asp-tRNA(Asn)/Glu-tRNA(Gln) amidotransferase C subunit
VALEEGLVAYLGFGDDLSGTQMEDNTLSWTTRSAVVICLDSIYHQRKSTSIGLLAQAALTARNSQEKHPVVLGLLKSSNLSNYRLFLLSKYIGRALGENYRDSQAHLAEMQKYIKTMNRVHAKNTKATSLSSSLKAPIRPDLETLKLSVKAYHKNFKENAQRRMESIESFIKTPSCINTKPSSMFTSYNCVKSDAPEVDIDVIKPEAGTANRRKLFNPAITVNPFDDDDDQLGSDVESRKTRDLLSESSSESLGERDEGPIIITPFLPKIETS